MKPFVVTLALAGAAFAQQASPGIPKIKFSDATLDNGLRVLISEDHYAPVYAICISYKVGSRDERPGRTGFAHLFEHMMFKGSENVGTGELDFLIYNNGGNSNGTTNTDRTSYYEVLPKNQVDLGLYLEADRMHGLVITQENLENQRQAVKEERRLRVDNQAYGQTSEKVEELIYDNFAYHHPVVGSLADLDAASVDDVKQFFKTYYAPNNAVLALVGDLNTAETLAKVKKYFGAIQRQTAPKPVDLSEQPLKAERRATLQDPLARLAEVDIAYRIPDATSPETRALGVAASILGGGGRGGRGGGGGNTSRLYNLLVQDKEVALNVSAGAERRGGPGIFHVNATIRQGKTPQEVEGLIEEEISKLYSQPVTDKELQRARIAMRRSAENRLTALSRAQALADAAAVYNDPNRVNTEIPAELAVTAADIQKAAKDLLVRAGERAMAALAMEEAATHYKLALDALQFLPMSAENRRRRFDLHFRRGRSFSQAGNWGPAKEDLEMAAKFAEIHDEERRAELYVGLAEASFGVLDVAGVRHYAGEAQRLADGAGRADLWADALAWKASAQAADGDIAGAIQSDRCAVARAGGIRSFALARTPLVLYWAGRTEEAVEQAGQAVENARESSDPAFLLYALQHQGLSLTAIGEYDKAIRIFDEACTFGRNCGALPLLARAMSMSVAPLLSLGDLDGARTRALESRELAYRVNFEPPLVSAGIDLLVINARLQDPGGSEVLLRETQAAVERAGGWHAWKWRLRLAQAQAELNLARHNWDEAITASSQVIAQSRSYRRPKYEAWGLATRAQAARRIGSQRASGDAVASVKIARRIGDPALLLKCLSVLLELDGSDELRSEAQRTVERMCEALSQEPLRSRFLAGAPSEQLSLTLKGRRR